MAFYKLLPKFVTNKLFGSSRDKLNIDFNDEDWILWQKLQMDFYQETQRKGIGEYVNESGYNILEKIDLTEKTVLEIGPGILPHYKFWQGKPSIFNIVDVKKDFIRETIKILKKKKIKYSAYLAERLDAENDKWKIPSSSIDVVFSFYNLEHLYPLEEYIGEIKRILKPGGILIGAIPSEGGLAWGLGRFFTTRRHALKKGIDYDKIISWEHPNFAEDILKCLDSNFSNIKKEFYPLYVPIIDINLIIKFIYKK